MDRPPVWLEAPHEALPNPALFYVSWWAAARLKTGVPANVRKQFERMMNRSSVKKALTDEGLSH